MLYNIRKSSGMQRYCNQLLVIFTSNSVLNDVLFWRNKDFQRMKSTLWFLI